MLRRFKAQRFIVFGRAVSKDVAHMDSRLVDVASLGNVSLLQSSSRSSSSISTTRLQNKRQRMYKNGPRNTTFRDFRNV